jgi:hypothetical protein
LVEDFFPPPEDFFPPDDFPSDDSLLVEDFFRSDDSFSDDPPSDDPPSDEDFFPPPEDFFPPDDFFSDDPPSDDDFFPPEELPFPPPAVDAVAAGATTAAEAGDAITTDPIQSATSSPATTSTPRTIDIATSANPGRSCTAHDAAHAARPVASPSCAWVARMTSDLLGSVHREQEAAELSTSIRMMNRP